MTENSDPSNAGPAGFRKADLLLLLPFVWQLALAPWANEVAWRPAGLPFMMVWQMGGILFATFALGLRYWLEPPEEEAPGEHAKDEGQ